MLTRQIKPERVPANSTLAAVAVALATMAIAGPQVRAAVPGPSEARTALSEESAARLMAAAVAAARDLLGVDRQSHHAAVIVRTGERVILSDVAGTPSWDYEDALPPPRRLPERLLDLPPPLC